ncbi:MAG TPA: hypothetical protein VKE74_24585 [Gemmataceae bacterium]|nr:hypothetical protein [Gemmataceae bacterium]
MTTRSPSAQPRIVPVISTASTGRAGPPATPRAYLRVVQFGAVLVVALLLRCWEWTGRGLWFDEAFTWRLVEYPLAEMMERAARDNSPPFYYLVLFAWVRLFGDSLAALRGLSVVCGLLTVAGMYLFVREAAGRRADDAGPVAASGPGESPGRDARTAHGVALFAAALTATSVFQVRYSDEVRPYALGAALAAFSAWALFRAIRPGPPSPRAWAGYGLVTLLFAYTHYYALFVVAAQAAFLAGWLLAGARWRFAAAARRPAFRYALLAAAVLVAGWLPWVPTFLRQRAQVQAAFWTPPLSAWTAPDLCYEMFIDPQPPGSRHPYLEVVLTTAVAAGLAVLGRRARSAEWYVILTSVGPLAASLAVSAADTNVPVVLRYFVFAHLSLLAALSLLVWRAPRGPVRVAAAGAVLAASLAVTVDFFHGLRLENSPGARGAAEFVAAHRRPGELVVVPTPLWYLPVAYHLNDDGVRLYDAGGDIPHYHGSAVLRPEDMIDGPGLETAPGTRLWVVNGVGNDWGRQEVPVPEGWVATGTYRFPEALRVGAAVVVVYERRPGLIPDRVE